MSARPRPEHERDDQVLVQFSIRAMLLATLFVAVLMSIIRACGDPVAPCMFGIAAAAIGYWLTVCLKRRRVGDVVASYFAGALVGTVAFERLRATPIIDWKTSSSVENEMLSGMVITAIVFGAAAAWRFRSPVTALGGEACAAADRVTAMRLERIFRLRRRVFALGALFIGLAVGIGPDQRVWSLSRAQSLVFVAAWYVTSLYALADVTAICHDVFRVGLRQEGLAYAMGHFLLCTLLFPIGIVLGPLLIRGDFERAQQSEQVVEGEVDS